MKNFLINFDNDELHYLISVLDDKILDLETKCQLLIDFKDEILTYLSNNKED